MDWANVSTLITPQIFKIRTEFGYGTGFLIDIIDNVFHIVTARHVLYHSNGNPPGEIHLNHPSFTQELTVTNCKLTSDPLYDIAIIQTHIESAKSIVRTVSVSNTIFGMGTSACWLGIPHHWPDVITLCAGHISSYLGDRDKYLIDGVLIRGMSGAPLVTLDNNNIPIIIGVMTSVFSSWANVNLPVIKDDVVAVQGLSMAETATYLNMYLTHYGTPEKTPVNDKSVD